MKFICSNEEDHRCHRLLRVLTDVHEHAPDGFDVLYAVEALEDHKGELTVHWNSDTHPFPSEAEKALFHSAWKAVGDEPYANVCHKGILPTPDPPEGS